MVKEETAKAVSSRKKSKAALETSDEKSSEEPKQKGESSKKADKGLEIESEKVVEEPKKKVKKGKDSPAGEELEESEQVVLPSGRDAIARPLPPALKGTATMLEGSGKMRSLKGDDVAAIPEKPAKKEKIPIDPSKVHVHDIEIPEELRKFQRGCLLKVRKVGNSRFSQEMTRCANQLFIKKLGRGQYFVPDYYILSEIQGWAKKWDTALQYMPIDDAIRQLHMQDVRSKMSATGEDLTKKVKDLTHVLKMRDDQLIKVQMNAEEQKASLSAEIENLHTQLDQTEQHFDELQTKMDDAETGTGVAEISLLKDQLKSLGEERDSNERLFREAQAKIGQLQNEIDSLRQQLASVGKSPVVVAAATSSDKPAKSKKPAPASAAPKPSPKVKSSAKAKPVKGKKKVIEEVIAPEDAAELDDLSDLLKDTSEQEGEKPVEEEPVEVEEQPVKDEEPVGEEPVDEAELAKAMAYKKPKWDDDDTSVEVKEDENVEMSDEELKEFERQQKKRESEDAGEESDEKTDEDSDEG